MKVLHLTLLDCKISSCHQKSSSILRGKHRPGAFWEGEQSWKGSVCLRADRGSDSLETEYRVIVSSSAGILS